jgi:ASCH domain
LIIMGIKDVENRSWSTRYRGRLAIHAGKTIDRAALAEHRALLPPDIPAGFILGTVELKDVVKGHPSRWALPGQYHWLLADPQRFDSPVPVIGKQGLWTWELADVAVTAHSWPGV